MDWKPFTFIGLIIAVLFGLVVLVGQVKQPPLLIITSMLAGLAGSVEVTGLNYRHELGFSLGYGFDAIAIALLGRSSPLGVVLASLLFASMRNGATRMQFLTQLPVDLISMIQALILLFVAADAIIRYIYRIKSKGERVVLTRGWGG